MTDLSRYVLGEAYESEAGHMPSLIRWGSLRILCLLAFFCLYDPLIRRSYHLGFPGGLSEFFC